MKYANEKPVLLIIGNLYNDPVPELAVKKLQKVLKPISHDTQVIAGDIINNEMVKGAEKYHQTSKSALILIKESTKRQIKAISLMRKTYFDICIVMLPFLILPIIYTKLRNRPLILYIGGRASKSIKGEIEHGSNSRIFMYCLILLLEIISFSLANKLIIESNSAVSFLGLSNYIKKIYIRGQYIDISNFKIEKDLKSRKITVGYIGRLSKEKGIIEFIRAASLVAANEKNVNFLIAGVGELTYEVLQYVQSNQHLSKRTQFIEWIDHEDMSQILNDLMVLVLPSYSEGIPNIVLESMACGTIVLSTPVGGIPDLIKDRKTGFIINKNLPEYIAADIEMILNYPNLDSIAENARLVIESEFNSNIVTEKYRKILYDM